MNNEPATPPAVVALVMVGATVAAVMVMASACVPVPPALVAVRVAVVVPRTDELPLITPVPVLTLRPRGKPVALKLVGELVAVIE